MRLSIYWNIVCHPVTIQQLQIAEPRTLQIIPRKQMFSLKAQGCFTIESNVCDNPTANSCQLLTLMKIKLNIVIISRLSAWASSDAWCLHGLILWREQVSISGPSLYGWCNTSYIRSNLLQRKQLRDLNIFLGKHKPVSTCDVCQLPHNLQGFWSPGFLISPNYKKTATGFPRIQLLTLLGRTPRIITSSKRLYEY